MIKFEIGVDRLIPSQVEADNLTEKELSKYRDMVKEKPPIDIGGLSTIHQTGGKENGLLVIM